MKRLSLVLLTLVTASGIATAAPETSSTLNPKWDKNEMKYGAISNGETDAYYKGVHTVQQANERYNQINHIPSR